MPGIQAAPPRLRDRKAPAANDHNIPGIFMGRWVPGQHVLIPSDCMALILSMTKLAQTAWQRPEPPSVVKDICEDFSTIINAHADGMTMGELAAAFFVSFASAANAIMETYATESEDGLKFAQRMIDDGTVELLSGITTRLTISEHNRQAHIDFNDLAGWVQTKMSNGAAAAVNKIKSKPGGTFGKVTPIRRPT